MEAKHSPPVNEKCRDRWTRGKTVVACGIAVGFVLVSAVIWHSRGVGFAGDTGRYLGGADNLLHGRPFTGKQASYLGYVLVIAINQALGWPLGVIVLLQFLAAGVAGVALFDLGRRLGGPWAGLAAAATLLLNPDLVRWHVYILTDSLYTSALVLVVWVVYRSVERGGGWYVVVTVAVLFAMLLRPNGWILIPAVGIYFICRSIRRPALRAATIAALGVAFLLCTVSIPPLRAGIEKEHPGQMLRLGEVLWRMPRYRLPMPAAPASLTDDWTGTVGYALSHLPECAALAAARVLVEMVHFRPYYPLWRNLMLVYLLPLYLFAAVGIARHGRQPLGVLALTVIAGHLVTIALTFADRDGRFFLFFLPLIALFSGAGFASVCGLGCKSEVESRTG